MAPDDWDQRAGSDRSADADFNFGLERILDGVERLLEARAAQGR